MLLHFHMTTFFTQGVLRIQVTGMNVGVFGFEIFDSGISFGWENLASIFWGDLIYVVIFFLRIQNYLISFCIMLSFICLFFPPFIYFTSHLYCIIRLKN